MVIPFRRQPFKSFVLRAFLDYYTSFEPPMEDEQSYACVQNKSVFSLRKTVFTGAMAGSGRYSRIFEFELRFWSKQNTEPESAQKTESTSVSFKLI